MPKNYFINEGNHIGGQEPQAIGKKQCRIIADADIEKGNLLEVTGDWKVGPAKDGSTAVVGVAFGDAKKGENVVIESEGFVKLDASEDISSGDKLVSAGSGKVKKGDAGTVIGTAFNSCKTGEAVYTKLILAN